MSNHPHTAASQSLPFDRVVACYDTSRGGDRRGRHFAEVLAPHFSRHGVTVEIGVGTGVIAKALVDDARPVLGIDLSIPMLRQAAERLPMRMVAGDAERLPLRDGSVDDCYSVWVLHVVGDMRAAMREAARVLRSGGRYLVVPGATRTPSDPIGLLTRRMNEVLRGGEQARDHPDRLAALASEVGLRVVGLEAGRPQVFEVAPNTVASEIESRAYSALWDVSDELWNQAAVSTIAALRALPEPDRPIARSTVHDVLVLERA